MAKNLKLNIKNTQIAKAINLGGLKDKLAKKKTSPPSKDDEKEVSKKEKSEGELSKEESPRIRARSRSAFAEKSEVAGTPETIAEETELTLPQFELPETTPEEILATQDTHNKDIESENESDEESEISEEPLIETKDIRAELSSAISAEEKLHAPPHKEVKITEQTKAEPSPVGASPHVVAKAHDEPRVKLGPTGRHISDLLPKYSTKSKETTPPKPAAAPVPPKESAQDQFKEKAKVKVKGKGPEGEIETAEFGPDKKGKAAAKFKEFRDVRPTKRVETPRTFDARDRHGFRDTEDEFSRHRKRRSMKMKAYEEEAIIRPTELSVRIPITIKDLASEMKLKAAELIAKMFLQGVIVTINSVLEDETTIQLLGQEFGCEITIDTTEEKRIRITDQTIQEEINSSNLDQLITRAPIVAFMGHVDHGKTSLIDAIRKSNRAASEAGAITQHIGAFRCHTAVGDIAILDTPGHEAFSAMRERGAEVTDIVVLVIAGDEGIRQQTIEAIHQAKEAQVTIVVALNKSDKPNFNAENVYRQLAEQELLPEAWGGQTITVNCSATTGEGISTLLEMLALQAEVLELQANPLSRARGTVLESELHKGLGAVATVLVQNGTLKLGDSLVCDQLWGRVKTMRDEFGKELKEAGPSTPVEITGLSGLPEAGQEFIVVKNEREAREIAEARAQGVRQKSLQLSTKVSLENMFQKAADTVQKKIFNVILRADVQGSLEALKVALQKIKSDKVDLMIIFAGVGEVSESDIQLAAASKATIIGFHTQIESHAEALIKQTGIQVKMHDIIYHAIDDVKVLMAAILDKLAQENDKGKADVKAVFKSSHYGLIAGCIVTEGVITRNNQIRVIRGGEQVWKGSISSLKRVKDDVREVQKGLECGIVFSGFNDIHEGDTLEAFETVYIAQEL